MTISEQACTEITQLIQEGECLNAHNLEAFYNWAEASYEALEFDPVQQQRFDEFCRSSCDYASMRLYMGVWMLKQALHKDTPEGYTPTYSMV
jgi:hypothetical protein